PSRSLCYEFLEGLPKTVEFEEMNHGAGFTAGENDARKFLKMFGSSHFHGRHAELAQFLGMRRDGSLYGQDPYLERSTTHVLGGAPRGGAWTSRFPSWEHRARWRTWR